MQVSLGYVIVYVPDVGAALGFYEESFGLKKRFITPEGDYGELDTGSTTLAFVSHELAGTNLDAAGGFTPLADHAAPPAISITLVTDDVNAAVSGALENGARLYSDPIDKPWGQTVAYIVDPFGALLEIATPVASG